MCDSLKDIHFCQGVDGPCSNIGKRRRRNTAYVDDEKNFVIMCDSCFELEQEYWKEMWAQYNSDRI